MAGKHRQKNLIWLQSGGCGGCSLSLMGAENPDFLSTFETAGIHILWHPSISVETGTEVNRRLDQVLNQEIKLDILCLEGSVIKGPDGTGCFHLFSGRANTPMMQIIEKLAALSDYVVGIGSCAAYGGITAGGGNSVEACGLAFDGDHAGGLLGKNFSALSGMPVINIPGCPVHPDWVVETLLHVSTDKMQPKHLDAFLRPKALSKTLVHHGCSRNEFYEFKASAENLGEMGCMMENLGCKGTQAAGDCNIRPWNGSGSCISGGYPCIACTEPNFEELDHSFFKTPKVAGIPVGLPTDMPKAWFVALASLSKAATPDRLRTNAVSKSITIIPSNKRPQRSHKVEKS